MSDIALQHARYLSETIGPRGSCTAAEKRAAEYVRDQMQRLGLKDVRIESFQGMRSAWQAFAVIFDLAILGHILFWWLRSLMPPVAYLPYVVLCFLIGAWWLYRTLTFDRTLLHFGLPKGPSQNVVGIVPAAGEPKRRLVLVGHLDSRRTLWILGGDGTLAARAFAPLITVGFFSLIAAPVLYGLGAFLDFLPLSYLGLATIALHILGVVLCVQADLTPYSPGANENAAAVGACLALAERLTAKPLPNTEVWVLASGCEVSGLDGIRDFLARHRAEMADALFLDLEGVGRGDQLIYHTHEGAVWRERIHPEALAVAQAAAARFPQFTPAGRPASGGSTEMGVVNHTGLRGLCLSVAPAGLTAHGDLAELARAVRGKTRRTVTDTADRLRPEALAMAREFAMGVMREWDSRG